MAEIPIFPLPLVIFPGGRLPLQIFEPRYLDMIKQCMSEDSGFGVVMIREGNQVLGNADDQLPRISLQGTYSKIIDFNQLPNGMLGILAEGQMKFAILDQYERPDRLMMANVEFLDQEIDLPLPEHQAYLATILQTLMQHQQIESLKYEVDLNIAENVGARLTELLPCDNLVKQRLFEMNDSLARLDEIEKVIAELQG